MVAIPRSTGVQQGPTTETGLRPASMAQSQIVPTAITKFAQTATNISFQEMQREAAQERKEIEEYQASQHLDARNQLRSFDNDANIALRELPSDQKTIKNYKNEILGQREILFSNLNNSFDGDKELQKLLKTEYETSKVSFEYGLDKELSRKRKDYNLNNIYSSISQINNRLETAQTDVEFLQIQEDLELQLKIGLSSGLITKKDIDRQQNLFKELRNAKATELLRSANWADAKAGKIRLDATDKNDKVLVDENYQIEVLKGADPIETADSMAINQGIIPTEAKKSMSAYLFNGDGNQKLETALRMQELINENVSLENQFSSKELAISKAISNRYADGLPVDKIIEYTEAEIKSNQSADRIIRQTKFNNEYAKSGKKLIETVDKLTKKIRGTQGFLGFGRAEVPEEIGINFRNIASDFYLNEGVDMPTAIDNAQDKILGEWAVTNVGKKRFQKFAPEVFYGEGDWIQSQAIQEVRKLTIDSLPNIKKEIRLQVIPSTINSGSPSYNVFRQKEEGGIIEAVLNKENEILVFKPEYKKTKDYKDYKDKIESLKITPEQEQEMLRSRKKRGSKKPVSQEEARQILSGGLY